MNIQNTIRNTIKNTINAPINMARSILSGGGESFLNLLRGGIVSRTRTGLLQEYKNIVFACVNAIAQDVAQYEPIIKRGKTVIDNHPIMDLLKRPNQYMTQFDLFEQIQSYMELSGEVFIYFGTGEFTRKPKLIELIPPNIVEVVIDSDSGEVKGYKVSKANGNQIVLDPEEVFHYKNFNPINKYRGLGVVEAGLLYIDLDSNLSEFQNNFIKNQATPSGVLALKGNIKTESFNKLKNQWKEEQAGTVNAGKTLFIREADASFTKIGLSIADLNVEGLSSLTEEKILKMFRVPKALLGQTDSTGLGRANVEAIEYIFAKRTIEPKLNKLDDLLKLIIEKFYGERVEVSHVSQIPEDQEFKLKERVAGVDKWITRNEIREQDGMPRIEGSDKLYVEFSKLPVNEQLPALSQSKQVGKIKVRKTIHKQTPIQEQKIEEAEVVELDVHNHIHEYKEKDFSVIEDPKQRNFYQVIAKLQDLNTVMYKKQIKDYLNQQQKDVIEQVENISKTFETVIGVMGFGREALTLSVANMLYQAFGEAGNLGLSYIGEPDTEFIIEQATRDAIFEATQRQLISFDELTSLKIQKQLALGIQNQEDLKQLTKRIESIYGEAKGYRAERIARTEAHKAVNQGIAESYKQGGYSHMKWVAIPPSCEFCRALDNTIIPIGSSFLPLGASVEGESGQAFVNNYSDIKYADLHPNCDCKLEPERIQKGFDIDKFEEELTNKMNELIEAKTKSIPSKIKSVVEDEVGKVIESFESALNE